MRLDLNTSALPPPRPRLLRHFEKQCFQKVLALVLDAAEALENSDEEVGNFVAGCYCRLLSTGSESSYSLSLKLHSACSESHDCIKDMA